MNTLPWSLNFIFFYCVGLVLGGSATILTLLLAARWLFPPLDRVVTRRVVNSMAWVILLAGTIAGYAYAMEIFIAYYGANKYELFTFLEARLGLGSTSWYSLGYYVMMSGSVLGPQVFWFERMRANYGVVFVVCLLVNLGMWFERAVIFVTSMVTGM